MSRRPCWARRAGEGNVRDELAGLAVTVALVERTSQSRPRPGEAGGGASGEDLGRRTAAAPARRAVGDVDAAGAERRRAGQSGCAASVGISASVRSTPKPHGATTMTSGSASRSACQGSVVECAPADAERADAPRPAPPAPVPSCPSRTADRSIPGTPTVGRGPGSARVRSASAARRARMPATSARPASVAPSTPATFVKTVQDAVDGAGVQRDDLPPFQRGGRPCARSPGLTAQTSQWVCVTMTSGASDASSASSTSYSGAPARSRSRTRASMSALVPPMSNVGRLTAGRRLTHAGKSHSCERATSRSPSAQRAHQLGAAREQRRDPLGRFAAPARSSLAIQRRCSRRSSRSSRRVPRAGRRARSRRAGASRCSRRPSSSGRECAAAARPDRGWRASG